MEALSTSLPNETAYFSQHYNRDAFKVTFIFSKSVLVIPVHLNTEEFALSQISNGIANFDIPKCPYKLRVWPLIRNALTHNSPNYLE